MKIDLFEFVIIQSDGDQVKLKWYQICCKKLPHAIEFLLYIIHKEKKLSPKNVQNLFSITVLLN